MYQKGVKFYFKLITSLPPLLKVQRCKSAVNNDRLSSCLKHIQESFQANLLFFIQNRGLN